MMSIRKIIFTTITTLIIFTYVQPFPIITEWLMMVILSWDFLFLSIKNQ